MKKRFFCITISLLLVVVLLSSTLLACDGLLQTNNNTQTETGDKVYTVSFSGEECYSIEKISVKENGTITLPNNPTRNNYKFLYWSLNGEKFDESTKITSDIVLVAVWGKIVNYTINHYKKNIYNDNYYLFVSESKTGAIGEKIDINEKNIVDYDTSSTLQQLEIREENQEFNVYYNPTSIIKIGISNFTVSSLVNLSSLQSVYNSVNSRTTSTACDYQIKTKFYWKDLGEDKTYTIYLSTNSNFSNSMEFTSDVNYIVFGVLVPSTTYYIKILCGTEVVEVGQFETADDIVRYVNVPNVSNLRDLGGWKIGENKRVAYSKLYRGAELCGTTETCSSEITESGINVFKNILKIKTELDLRAITEISTENSAQLDNYLNQYLANYTWLVPENDTDKLDNATYTKKTDEAFQNIFNLLSDESNYPVYFHCVWGADRTGSLAFILNGLLGVSFDDLVKDYSLTSFSASGKRKCKVPDKNWNEVTKDEVENYGSLYMYYWQIMTYYHTEDNLLSSAIENYLTTAMGVSQNNIDKFKNIMIENI